MSQKVRTRFAPSPTGNLHIGGLRTALYAYALAKNQGGGFILRIEDTDKKREVAGAKEQIQKLLERFGLVWDEYYVQSQRLELYQQAARALVEKKKAFYCACAAKNARKEGYSQILRDPCRDKNLKDGAIKLMVPENREINYQDYVIGKKITWKSSEVADTTLLKSDGYPTYHLAVVVDDHDMQISHVLRGHDWLPSTPVHLLVYDFLDFKPPQIGHLTDILDPDGGKLSKRKGSVTCEAMLSEGYLPEAILNFVMLLGWAPKDNREIFTLEEFVNAFDAKGLQRANPVFNRDKLDWFNGQYIRRLSLDDLNSRFVLDNPEFARLEPKQQLAVTGLIRERINKLSDLDKIAGFFYQKIVVDKTMLGKNYPRHLNSALKVIENLDDWNLDSLNEAFVREIKNQNYQTGEFFMDLRIAVCASRFTPPINESIIILGPQKTKEKIKSVLSA